MLRPPGTAPGASWLPKSSGKTVTGHRTRATFVGHCERRPQRDIWAAAPHKAKDIFDCSISASHDVLPRAVRSEPAGAWQPYSASSDIVIVVGCRSGRGGATNTGSEGPREPSDVVLSLFFREKEPIYRASPQRTIGQRRLREAMTVRSSACSRLRTGARYFQVHRDPSLPFAQPISAHGFP